MSYTPVDRINVLLGTHKVGRLALIDRRIYFEYDPDFIATGLQISPYKLPLKAGAVYCEETTFDGLFGVFNDSLPDGWGRLLLDRQMRRHGIPLEKLTPLDRLTHVGPHGMGALRYTPEVDTPALKEGTLNLDQLAQNSTQVLGGEVDMVLSELLALAGSSAGARPKIMAGISKNRKQLIHGQQQLPKGYTHWLVKFAARSDSKDSGAIEYAYSLMAKAAGIAMPETYLFPAEQGTGYFGVQRFDRVANRPIHMLSLSGYLHADHRFPSLDYKEVLQATWLLTRHIEEVKNMFRLATFNVLAHNRDDHAKNFAFLMQEDGTWNLSPAYDLTFSAGPGGEQSTMVMGEGRSPGTTHLLKLAEAFDIKEGHQIIDKVQGTIALWKTFADEAGVSATSKKQIARAIA